MDRERGLLYEGARDHLARREHAHLQILITDGFCVNLDAISIEVDQPTLRDPVLSIQRDLLVAIKLTAAVGHFNEQYYLVRLRMGGGIKITPSPHQGYVRLRL
jgi:hypothetical protein